MIVRRYDEIGEFKVVIEVSEEMVERLGDESRKRGSKISGVRYPWFVIEDRYFGKVAMKYNRHLLGRSFVIRVV